jgi:DNA invertase Pin-like site-specific DNA recombinase
MSTALYARVSTERQTLAQTIDQQVERLTAHVQPRGRPCGRRIFSVMMGIVAPRSIGRRYTKEHFIN